jgi:hypothetical protein
MAKRRGFVVWDAELTEVRDMIVHAGGKGAVDDVEVKDLCASDDTREGEIHANVVDALRDADRIIGVTDRANANVGFELGFAWG